MFREEFKYYKSKKPPPDLKNVIDFNNNPKDARKINVDKSETIFGMKPPNQWEVYELISNPGLIFIKNPFTIEGQVYLSARCLQDYTKKPNKSNLDIHGIIADDEDWWSLAKSNINILQKLRWITFGYHHNWDTKVYDETNKSQFPVDLYSLCKYISRMLGFEDFEPQAAIVNYYHLDSTLSGHTDHSEQNLEAPLFSFSFGQSAIFLLGGKTIIERPAAMFLHSGDVIVMSKSARLCYHGVPKILSSSETVWRSNFDVTNEIPREFSLQLIKQLNDISFCKDFIRYLKNSRININVRQVLHNGQTSLSGN